ncbi:MAG: DUF4974 domain-containing protein [Prevotella sp.]|jgi:hypothetical protein|nr:DUF4974 domain-containing protein [Prevotella sp.]
MEMINDNIRQLLVMLDNPDAYTEQEIQDIINHDEDTREIYRLMVEINRSSFHRKNDETVDIDAAWKRFSQKLQPEKHGRGWSKIAASFIGMLLISGIAFAAINFVRQYKKKETPNTKQAEYVEKSVTNISAGRFNTDTVNIQPVVYDNISLEKMLPEIAANYHVKVTFVNEEARQFRFRFVWNPRQNIGQVVSDLNQFERLTVTLKDNEIIVK